MISVVSQVLKDSLVDRGVDADKILVNPNGADLDAYSAGVRGRKRLAAAARAASRRRRLCHRLHRDFGGWHGIDVLAAAIPEICGGGRAREIPVYRRRRFTSRCIDAESLNTGCRNGPAASAACRRPEGARLLRACDIYVSPHNAHMVDSQFFGSPTKLFEYMAMGGGIVATATSNRSAKSCRPASSRGRSRCAGARRGDRARCCANPGDVGGVRRRGALSRGHAPIRTALGRERAQAAVERDYSWSRHVEPLWPCADRVRPRQGRHR